MSTPSRRSLRAGSAIVLTLLLTGATIGCSSDGTTETGGAGGAGGGTVPSGELATAETVRLGYFPNVTHAPAIVGVEKGFFEAELGETTLETSTYNSGTEVIEAIFADALDVSFIGPNPAINGFAKSNGEAVRIVSGSTSGGAFFITQPEIETVDDLRDKKIATPSLGNTQDVALRAWLKDQGLSTDTAGGGDVAITPLENADTLAAFIEGSVDGAWVPEPWATRLVQEGGGKVFLDEATLWPDGQFVTTHLLVRTQFLAQYPGTVKALITGELAALDFIAESSDEAKTVTNGGIERITTKRLPDAVIDSAWGNLEFTWNPVASSLQKSADDAIEAGLLDPVDLKGIYDLALLNSILKERGVAEVEAL